MKLSRAHKMILLWYCHSICNNNFKNMLFKIFTDSCFPLSITITTIVLLSIVKYFKGEALIIQAAALVLVFWLWLAVFYQVLKFRVSVWNWWCELYFIFKVDSLISGPWSIIASILSRITFGYRIIKDQLMMYQSSLCCYECSCQKNPGNWKIVQFYERNIWFLRYNVWGCDTLCCLGYYNLLVYEQ